MSSTAPNDAISATLDTLLGFPELHGSRVRLREPRTDDADALFAIFADTEVTRYWSHAPWQSRAEAEARLAEIAKAFAERDKLNWVIVDTDDVVIGTTTLFQFMPRHRRAEIGYALHSAHWGRGLAREAVTLALNWAFDTLGLHRVDASIDPDNQASRGLLLKLGFVREGCLRESYFNGDVVTDSELFGLLAKEWRAATR